VSLSLSLRLPPGSTLFPYTALFRSIPGRDRSGVRGASAVPGGGRARPGRLLRLLAGRGRRRQHAPRPGTRGSEGRAPRPLHGEAGGYFGTEAPAQGRPAPARAGRCARRRKDRRGCAGNRRRGALQGRPRRGPSGRSRRGPDRARRRARSLRETDMSTREVVVVSGVRTPIGGYGGSLKDFPATRLGALAIREAVARAKVEPAAVGHVVMGSVIHGEARDMYLSRVAAVDAGL